MGFDIPSSPSIFSRYVRTFVPHNGQMTMPSHSSHFDYEGEMTIVIGQPARHVSEEDALQYIAGYTICNDGSVRDWQKAGLTPPKWLQPGDKIEIEIDSIGTLAANVASTSQDH